VCVSACGDDNDGGGREEKIFQREGRTMQSPQRSAGQKDTREEESGELFHIR
jgi:hypothetical protein